MSPRKMRLPYRGFSSALLHDSISDDDLRSFRECWEPAFTSLRANGRRQPDEHWDWVALVGKGRADTNVFTFSVTAGGETQGMTIARRGEISKWVEKGECGRPEVSEILLVERVATAPWNRGTALGSHQSQYSLVGTILLREVVMLSKKLGLLGRVGLHALAGAETFYAHIGMVKLEAPKDSLAYFEFDPEGAERFLTSP